MSKKQSLTALIVRKKMVPENSAFYLTLKLDSDLVPQPGQFYMLKSIPSSRLLGRPISVYRTEQTSQELLLTFLILIKGRGTGELAQLEAGTRVEVLGPSGNSFPMPTVFTTATDTDKPAFALIGGGIGVAPVAALAENLPAKSYDFFAAFKTGSYGLDFLAPNNLIITTDDGSIGTLGMLSAVFTEQAAVNYTTVYACGPEPMLAYVQKVCKAAKVQCYLSLEAPMACGVGACLGCTIRTIDGNKRCCTDGPVFDASTVVFGRDA